MSILNILKKLNSRDTRLIPQFPKLNKTFKIISLVVGLAFVALLTHQIFAANDTPNTSAAVQKFEDKQSAIDKGNNQESWMNESMMSNAMSVNTAIAGTIPNAVLQGKTTSWIPNGMLGMANQSIAYLYNPPASGVQYIASTVNSFLGKPAYADNGYQGLQGIMPIWKSFRNAVYILFSIVFIGIGIAIMLRVKISQQAVVTIQSAIPQLITSLILVTFSYAIAGLLIDLSYVFQALVLAILYNSKGGMSSSLFPGDLINPSFSTLMNVGFWNFYFLAIKATPVTALTLLAGIPSGIIAGLIAGLGFGTTAIIGVVVGAAAFILVFLIILIMILVYTIKFFFGMVKCYITLMLRIILAPLEIGMGAIPNSKMNFSTWIWNVIANLAVFPISLIFLVFVNLIIKSINTSGLWAPPMLGGSWLLGPAIGLSALMILSKLPSMIPEFIFNIKPTPWGKAIGEGFKAVPGVKTVQQGYGLAKEAGLKAAGGWAAEKMGFGRGGSTVQQGPAPSTTKPASKPQSEP